jgi:5-methyltetrahydrofolate--homocysteine methyltransferase
VKLFTDKQWDTLYKAYSDWWENKLGRPILPITFVGKDPGRHEPKNPLLHFSNVSDFSITPEQIVDRMDYELHCREYFLDEYPRVEMHAFGAGVIAAFLGAKPPSADDTVWFHPPEKPLPLSELSFVYDENNIWLNRIKDIYRAGMKKWGGEVVMCMTDLGGILDILSTFCETENLLMAFYDDPESIKRCVNELHKLWFRFYNEINDIISGSRGYSDWAGILYKKPSYMLQCDFSYMINEKMFGEFVMPELESTASCLYKNFYHLDGVGQLPHLKHLLQSKNIFGIQWVPGIGEQHNKDWSEVYKSISNAGKKIQGQYGLDFQCAEILAVVQHPDDLCKTPMCFPMTEKAQTIKNLEKLGILF